MVMEGIEKMLAGLPKGPSEVNGGESGRETAVNTEQLPGAGRLTPGTIAMGLVDTEGVLRRSEEAEERRVSPATVVGDEGNQAVVTTVVDSAPDTVEPPIPDVPNLHKHVEAEETVAADQEAI